MQDLHAQRLLLHQHFNTVNKKITHFLEVTWHCINISVLQTGKTNESLTSFNKHVMQVLCCRICISCHMCQKDSTKIIPSYTYIHSYETRSANESTSISRMQNCPITLSKMCFFYRFSQLFSRNIKDI